VVDVELIYEIEPVYGKEELLNRLGVLKGLVDWVDVPDSPMGRPSQFSPVVSCLIRSLESIDVIAHIRTIDLNSLALRSILKSLALCGVRRVVFVRGDLVPGVTVVKDVEPESAVVMARQCSPNVSPGLTLSLRKEPGAILERMSVRADFYLVLNLNNQTVGKLIDVHREARRLGVKVYPYLVLATETNYDILARSLGSGKLLKKDEALHIASACADLVDGFLISSPLDFKEGLSLLSELRRIF
jgi:5,10-methylenetetrahydrofolate reductase